MNTQVLEKETQEVYGPNSFNPFLEGEKLFDFPLLNDFERLESKKVDDKLSQFERVVKSSVSNIGNLYSNGMILSGAPGTGKTYNTTKWLDELIDNNLIDNYSVVSGKITPVTLFQFLRENNGPNNVIVLDDCDVFWNLESLNILKAAMQTKSEYGERKVTYGSRGQIQSFIFEGYVIMITNHEFKTIPNDHIRAVLDRVHLMNLNLTTQDLALKNTEIVEDFINNKIIDDKVKIGLKDLYRNEISQFIENEVFQKADVQFSVRFIMKIVDLFTMFGNSWKQFSTEFKKLERINNGIVTA